MGEIKLLFVGSQSAGKTTAIATVSEVNALDYGEFTLDTGQKLRCYAATSGQPHSYLAKGTFNGLIILINNAGSDPIGDIARYVDTFRELISKIKTVIGITHLDVAPEPELPSYHDYLREHQIQLPLMAVDPRSRSSIMALIKRFQ